MRGVTTSPPLPMFPKQPVSIQFCSGQLLMGQLVRLAELLISLVLGLLADVEHVLGPVWVNKIILFVPLDHRQLVGRYGLEPGLQFGSGGWHAFEAGCRQYITPPPSGTVHLLPLLASRFALRSPGRRRSRRPGTAPV